MYAYTKRICAMILILITIFALSAPLSVSAATNQEKIDYLNQLIEAFSEPITLEDESAVTEALEIFDELSMDERSQIDYVKLSMSAGQLKKLQKEAAEEVDANIAAIDETIKRSSDKEISSARKSYDALTPGSKKFVKKLADLEEAEQALAAIEEESRKNRNEANDDEEETKAMLVVVVFVSVTAVVALFVILIVVLTMAKRKRGTRKPQ